MLQYLQVFGFVISCYVYFSCIKEAFSITNANLRQTQDYFVFGKIIFATNALIFFRYTNCLYHVCGYEAHSYLSFIFDYFETLVVGKINLEKRNNRISK